MDGKNVADSRILNAAGEGAGGVLIISGQRYDSHRLSY